MTTNIHPRRVVVFGARGFIGRHVVSALAAAGIPVRAVDLAPHDKRSSGSNPLVERVFGDVGDESFVVATTKSCDVAIYLASNSLPDSANYDLSSEISMHVRKVIKTAEICDSQSVSRFLFASSGGAIYGYDSPRALGEEDATMPLNAYGVSKLSIEHYLRILSKFRQIRTVSLRISNAYGEGQIANRGQGFIAAAMAHVSSGAPLTIWGDGTVTRDFVHISDVADAFLRASFVDGPAGVFNIGAGCGYELNSIMKKIEGISDRRFLVNYGEPRHIDVASNVLDIRSVQRALNWYPKINIDDGLSRTWNWWLQRTPGSAVQARGARSPGPDRV